MWKSTLRHFSKKWQRFKVINSQPSNTKEFAKAEKKFEELLHVRANSAQIIHFLIQAGMVWTNPDEWREVDAEFI